MDKKAFLGGDILIWIYSLLILVFIGIVFSVLFVFSSPDLSIKNYFNKADINPLSKISPTYDYINYYLYTKIRIDKRETSLSELIPIYCFNLDENYKEDIKRISAILSPDEVGINLWCDLKRTKCNRIIKYDDYGERLIDIDKENKLILSTGSLTQPNLLNLPGLNLNSNICLELEVKHFDKNKLITRINSEQEFERKVKEILKTDNEILGLNINDFYLLSQTKDLWYFNENMWCNLGQENYSKCQKFFSEEFIKCKGDYSCLER